MLFRRRHESRAVRLSSSLCGAVYGLGCGVRCALVCGVGCGVVRVGPALSFYHTEQNVLRHRLLDTSTHTCNNQ